MLVANTARTAALASPEFSGRMGGVAVACNGMSDISKGGFVNILLETAKSFPLSAF